MNQTICLHLIVVVDYDHPNGLIKDLKVKDLQNSDPKNNYPSMKLQNPRCAMCRAQLDAEQLRKRIAEDGDLYDSRFEWIFVD